MQHKPAYHLTLARVPRVEQGQTVSLVSWGSDNITEEIWAEIFDVDQSTISRCITILTSLIDQATEEFRPSEEEASETIRGPIALVDGTLWPCWSWSGERELWAWKYKKTGHGSLIITNLEGCVTFVSEPVPPCPRQRLRNRVGLRMRNSRALFSDDSLALVQVHNCGRCGIEADDFKRPLSVTFEGRDIISAGVADFSSPDIEPRILGEPGINIDGSTVVLPKIPLNRGDSFRMVVFLSGTGSGVTGTLLQCLAELD